MTGNLDEVIAMLLKSALSALFGGDSPPVELAVSSDLFEVNLKSADGMAGEPRPDDRIDQFSFDPAAPPAFFTLTQPPYPGPRRVRLTTEQGDRITLREDEVIWDETDNRVFSLNLRPIHDLISVNGMMVLYEVTAVFTTLKASQTLTLQFQSGDDNQLEQAEALAIGVIELNRQQLIDNSTVSYAGGDYGAAVTIKSLKLIQGASPATNQRYLTYRIEVELKATRAMAEDEGMPIERIRTPGRPLDFDRFIDIHIDVDV